MKRIAKFHKVSLEQFKKDWIDTFGLDEEANIEEIYELSLIHISEPTRPY